MDSRSEFHKHLREIRFDIIAMGSMVEKATSLSIKALLNHDFELANQIIFDDKSINQKRFNIEEKCIELIATQQPMASDLRMIVAVLNIIVELERIGDQAEGIAKIAIMIGDEPPLNPLVEIAIMAEKVNSMLRRSIGALINQDVGAARQTELDDDEVDQLYDQVFHELLRVMIEDPSTVTRATRLVWVIHNLERSADRVTNICKRVNFMATGKRDEIVGSHY